MDQKKQHLLDTARGLFLGQGYKATTMQSIADAAGVSKGAVYLHFSSKKDIFFEILLESEAEVWQKVRRVSTDATTTARQKLAGVIEVHFEYIQENRLLTELQVQEVGMALTEEMLAQTLAMRVRWQTLFDDSIGNLLGNESAAWKADLGFTVVAVLETYHACLVVDDLQIEKQALIEYLLLLVETLGPVLAGCGQTPMLNSDYLDERQRTLVDLEQKRQDDLRTVLAKMEQTLSGLRSGQPADQHAIREESLGILQQECFSAEPRLAIIQGMLAGLRGVTELAWHRQRLADLMNVRLV